MKQESERQGLNVGSETWGGKGCIGEREYLSADSVSSRSKAQAHCLPSGSSNSDFQVCVCLVSPGVLVYLVISLVLKLSPRILYSSMNQAAGGTPLLTRKHRPHLCICKAEFSISGCPPWLL